MRNRRFIPGILVMALVFGMTVIGCATASNGGSSSGSAKIPGSLTITGIPDEYNGKYASFAISMGNSGGSKNFLGNSDAIFASAEDASKLMGSIEGTAITNGEVKLLLFKQVPFVNTFTAYTGSSTLRVELCIRDTAESDQIKFGGILVYADYNKSATPDFIFPSVTFVDGTATVNLNDAFKVGYITITGIPAPYDQSHGATANVVFDSPSLKADSLTYHFGASIMNGTVTCKFYRLLEKKDYTPYTGMLDMTLYLGNIDNPNAVTLLFKALMTDDNATLDFSQGIKQNIK